jgi:hypothetical protein
LYISGKSRASARLSLLKNAIRTNKALTTWKKGNVNPSVFYLQEIAEALGVALNEVLKIE